MKLQPIQLQHTLSFRNLFETINRSSVDSNSKPFPLITHEMDFGDQTENRTFNGAHHLLCRQTCHLVAGNIP